MNEQRESPDEALSLLMVCVVCYSNSVLNRCTDSLTCDVSSK